MVHNTMMNNQGFIWGGGGGGGGGIRPPLEIRLEFFI